MTNTKIIKYGLVCSMLIAGTVFNIRSKSNGLSSAYTGAPSEGTCVSCHATYSLQTSGTNYNKIKLTGNFTGGGYIPDSTYKIVVTYKETGKSVFGFQLTALQDKNVSYPTPAGTFISKDSRTSTFSQTAGTTTRYYIEHTSTGTSAVSTDSVSYVFEWKAPSSNLGNIKFHLIFNVTNNNNNDNGDYIYSKSFVVSPSTLLPVAKAKISDTLFCSNTPINFVGTSTNNASSYSWKFPGGSITTSSNQNPVVSYSTTGTKIAILETKNSKGFSKPDTLTFNVIQGATAPVLTPSPTNGPVKICSGDSTLFKVSSALNHSYIWSPYAQKSLTIYAKNSNSYVVTATNSNGCKKTSSPIQLIVNQRPEITYQLSNTQDSQCIFSPLTIQLKNKNYADSFKVNLAGNSFKIDSTFKLNLNKGSNLFQFFAKNTNGCVSYPISKTIYGKDSANAPQLSVVSRTTNSITFGWTTIPDVNEYKYSIDSGKTWLNPSKGKLSTEETIGVNTIGQKKLFLLKAITSTYCGISKIASLIGQPSGCNDIPYSIVPQKIKPCLNDSFYLRIKGLYNLGKYSILYESRVINDTNLRFLADQSKTYTFEITDTSNKICGSTIKSLTVQIDSGKSVITNITPSDLIFCGGKTSEYLIFNAQFTNGDSLFSDKQFIGNSNPVTLKLLNNKSYQLSMKNANSCFGRTSKIEGKFKEKIEPAFSVNYLNAYNYQFNAQDTVDLSQWLIVYNNEYVDSANGNKVAFDLSPYSDKSIKILHLKRDTFQKICVDSASKWIMVLNYSNTKKLNPNKMYVSPNPARENEILLFTGLGNIREIGIYQNNGQRIGQLKQVSKNQFQLPIGISNSMYLIEIKTDKGNFIQKIVVH